ncbi:hypothetical protein ACFF45_22010, partial [Streptomyces cinereospinus]
MGALDLPGPGTARADGPPVHAAALEAVLRARVDGEVRCGAGRTRDHGFDSGGHEAVHLTELPAAAPPGGPAAGRPGPAP